MIGSDRCDRVIEFVANLDAAEWQSETQESS